MTITRFSDLAEKAGAMSQKTVMAVIEAQDENTIRAVLEAAGHGITRPAFIGKTSEIKELITMLGSDPSDYEIIRSCDVVESLKKAVDMIHTGKATALMKGKIGTAEFLKAVVNKENRLLTGSRLSLAALYETKNYHKVFAVSDVGVNIYPDFDCKRSIVEHAVGMMVGLGKIRPKVAILAAVEKVNPKMPETVDADALKKMYQNGGIKNCIIEGPISFDLATSAKAAGIKGYDSPVAGDADLLIVPDIVSGNVLVKCLTGMAGATTAGTVLGAKVPIVLTSRSAETSDKYYSIALAACLGG